MSKKETNKYNEEIRRFSMALPASVVAELDRRIKETRRTRNGEICFLVEQALKNANAPKVEA